MATDALGHAENFEPLRNLLDRGHQRSPLGLTERPVRFRHVVKQYLSPPQEGAGTGVTPVNSPKTAIATLALPPCGVAI